MAQQVTLSPFVIPLIATAIIAGLAYLTKSRCAFFVGLFACWAVAGEPHPGYIEWRPGTSYEHMYLHHLREWWEKCCNGVPIASLIGTVIGLIASELTRYVSRPAAQATRSRPETAV